MHSLLLFIDTFNVAQSLLLLAVVHMSTNVWLVALFDVSRNRFPNNEKIAWRQLIVYLPLLGAVIYLLLGRNRKIL
ncbi:MAG: PLD nuclease N-terminal domain-containing protein [Cyclobacteriaceae bacterium]